MWIHMTLTTNGKNYIAQHFGTSNCFASSGIAYTDPAGEPATGSTSDVVATLKLDDGGLSRGADGEIYDDIVTANDGAVTNTDIVWISSNDGSPADEAKYCAAAVTPTPTPGPTPAPGVAGTFEFKGAATGTPTVTLDLSSLIMKQALDYHFEMNDIKITNTSGYTVYLAMEIKLFKGALTSCPTLGWVFDGMDRTAPPHKNVRIKSLEPGEAGIYNADFFQPLSIIGVHTICLIIWGAWTQDALKSEISGITG